MARIKEDPLFEDGDFIGAAKSPSDLHLAEVAAQSLLGLTPAQFAHKKSLNREFGENQGFVGPEKAESDLFLSRLLDPTSSQVLTDVQRQNPTLTKAVVGKRESIEAFLGLQRGEISAKGGRFEQFVSRDKKFRDQPDPVPAQFFSAIEDVQLDFGQRQRFDALVASGEIDPSLLYADPKVDDGRTGMQRFKDRGKEGLTLKQAINIVIDPNSPAPSRFDPTTGLEFAPIDRHRANQLANEYLRSQGLPTLPSALPPGTNLEKRQLVLSEQGRAGSRVPPEGFRRRMTLEEMTLVAELMSGHSRAFDNPRDVPGTFDDTLLSDDFLV
jgi:hypothetical protein